MWKTLRRLKGNARACVWLDPMWGIPHNLYAPYAALYMRETGLTPAQIGMVSSITLIAQIISALLSGVLTDKLGRRRTTLLFDLLSWSVPEILWMCSQNFAWFAAAALFNGMWRITMNSWSLLMVEDADEDMIVKCFSLTNLTGLLAAFIAPAAKLIVDACGIVLTMRLLHGIAAVSMTIKFIALYLLSEETVMGRYRMQKTKNTGVFLLLWQCREVFIAILKDRRMLYTIGVSAVFQLIGAVNSSFWALLVTERIGIAGSNIALFTTLKPVVALPCILLLAPRLSQKQIRQPMLTGWAVFFLSQLILLIIPAGPLAVPLLSLSVVLEAAAISVMDPLVDSMLIIHADAEERARVLGLVHAATLLPITAIPACAGMLANVNIIYPFILNFCMYAVGAVFTVGATAHESAS